MMASRVIRDTHRFLCTVPAINRWLSLVSLSRENTQFEEKLPVMRTYQWIAEHLYIDS